MSIEYRIKYESGELDDFVFPSLGAAQDVIDWAANSELSDMRTIAGVVACDDSHWKAT